MTDSPTARQISKSGKVISTKITKLRQLVNKIPLQPYNKDRFVNFVLCKNICGGENRASLWSFASKHSSGWQKYSKSSLVVCGEYNSDQSTTTTKTICTLCDGMSSAAETTIRQPAPKSTNCGWTDCFFGPILKKKLKTFWVTTVITKQTLFLYIIKIEISI